MISLKNKNVLITGGSRGIGKACVKMFLDAGANVAFTFRSAQQEADKILTEYDGINLLKHYQVDLSDKDQINGAVVSILNDFKSIEVLVNNAGIWKEAAIAKSFNYSGNEKK